MSHGNLFWVTMLLVQLATFSGLSPSNYVFFLSTRLELETLLKESEFSSTRTNVGAHSTYYDSFSITTCMTSTILESNY